MTFLGFERAVAIDFEFYQPEGETPRPLCVATVDMVTGAESLIDLRAGELGADSLFQRAEETLLVAYFAPAELSCFLALGLPLPDLVVDIYAEVRKLFNGTALEHRRDLYAAASVYGIAVPPESTKLAGRELAMNPEQLTEDRFSQLSAYCLSDARVTAELAKAIQNNLTPAHALHRGRYSRAVACIEFNGIPIDIASYEAFVTNRSQIQASVIDAVNDEFRVYDGTVFRAAAFRSYLDRHGLHWPLLPSGQLALDDTTFKTMAGKYPVVSRLRKARQLMAMTRSFNLPIGSDGRHRAMLSPFGASTGRNRPSSTRYVFGLPAWCRGFVQPSPGHSLVYADYARQEIGIVSALSGDEALQASYRTTDPYIDFGVRAELIAPDATDAQKAAYRPRLKACVLGVQYGRGARSLAEELEIPLMESQALLDAHRRTFAEFWRWSDAAVDFAFQRGYIDSVYGWRLNIVPGCNPRQVRNFPAQANGAEIMRQAAILMTERGLSVCGVIHDAFVVEAQDTDLESTAFQVRQAMVQASKTILSGFALDIDLKMVRHPGRLLDSRSQYTWDLVAAATGVAR